MGHEDHGHVAFLKQPVLDAMLEEVRGDLRVDSRQRIIEQHKIHVRVAGPCETDTSLLATAQVHALLADLRLFAIRQLLDVDIQSTGA
eukprot:scaffold7890_cov315-Pinguiococcus_pyrenoidosus.AAC.1